MINVNVPLLPILGKHFMSDNKHTVMIEASLSGVKLAGLIDSLQCGTRERAKTMNRQLPAAMVKRQWHAHVMTTTWESLFQFLTYYSQKPYQDLLL